MEEERTKIIQNILKVNKQNREICFTKSKIYYKVIVMKTV